MAEEIKPNSKKYKEQVKKEEHRSEKVVQGEVTTKKKSLAKRAENAMLSEDAGTVKEYLFWDVLIPAFKELVAESVKKAVDAIFYGDRRTSSSLERNKGTTYVRYDKASYERDKPYYYSSKANRDRNAYNRRAVHDFDDIVLSSRTDAENVLDAMVDSTMNYGLVSVADFYDFVGLDPKYTDWKWGWYELSSARVIRVRDGYVIDLPRPVVLDEIS